MRQKTSLTIVEQAIISVPGFDLVFKRLDQQVVLKGQSHSTLNNYIRRIALISLHFNRLPEAIDEDELNEYLVALARDPKSPSRSSFKHMVYGLRYYYRLLGMNKKAIALPSLKKDTKLPVILNRSELKELFAAPQLLKHRIVLTLIYNPTTKRNLQLQFVPTTIDSIEKKGKPKETASQIILRITGRDVCKCPFCKHETMHRIKVLPPIRAPAGNLPDLLKARLL